MTRQIVVTTTVLWCFAVALTVMVNDVVVAQTGTTAAVTFYKDVAPLLQKNCETCHRPGQIAPMAFQTYESTRPWARAIKAAVLSKKMPPWFAEGGTAHLLNDRSLKPAEIDVLVKWADAGAPAGKPTDAPRPISWPDGGWQIKPDLIVDGPSYDVPAKGIVEWTWFVLPGNFKEDTWVTSVEVKPSEPTVTHHICLAYIPHHPDTIYNTAIARTVPRDDDGVEIARGRGAGAGGAAPAGNQAGAPPAARAGGPQQLPPDFLNTPFGILARSNGLEECYEPGRPPADFRPFNAAKLIPAGTDIAVNVHYTPNGKPVTDHVKIGFTVAKTPPKRRYLALSTSSPSDRKQFAIPPLESNWEAPPAIVTFTRDVEVVGLMPHMHVRGKAARFYLDHPDGKTETILDVPRYDFNWQLWYDTSIMVPRGSKMRVIAWYDNSPGNKFNPNPKATVYYGDQTWEEMHFPSYGVVVDDIKLTQRDVVAAGGFVGGGAVAPPQPAPAGR
ncbi:MAG TPA: hypothetical protein VGF24_05325 [Vicinamibacterales bacterium]|jgi:hypothetical protein